METVAGKSAQPLSSLRDDDQAKLSLDRWITRRWRVWRRFRVVLTKKCASETGHTEDRRSRMPSTTGRPRRVTGSVTPEATSAAGCKFLFRRNSRSIAPMPAHTQPRVSAFAACRGGRAKTKAGNRRRRACPVSAEINRGNGEAVVTVWYRAELPQPFANRNSFDHFARKKTPERTWHSPANHHAEFRWPACAGRGGGRVTNQVHREIPQLTFPGAERAAEFRLVSGEPRPRFTGTTISVVSRFPPKSAELTKSQSEGGAKRRNPEAAQGRDADRCLTMSRPFSDRCFGHPFLKADARSAIRFLRDRYQTGPCPFGHCRSVLAATSVHDHFSSRDNAVPLKDYGDGFATGAPPQPAAITIAARTPFRQGATHPPEVMRRARRKAETAK